ncbi:hypothetical protein D3C85_374720 [compost metagenome]
MAIKMRLDTQSLRALIADNPELEVELTREVVRNISDDILRVALKQRVDDYLSTQIIRSGSYYSPQYKLSPQIEKLIADAVVTHATAHLGQTLEDRVNDAVSVALQQGVTRLRQSLNTELKSMMQELLTPEMAKELMKESLFS